MGYLTHHWLRDVPNSVHFRISAMARKPSGTAIDVKFGFAFLYTILHCVPVQQKLLISPVIYLDNFSLSFRLANIVIPHHAASSRGMTNTAAYLRLHGYWGNQARTGSLLGVVI